MERRRFGFLLAKGFDFKGYSTFAELYGIRYEKYEFDKNYFENLAGYNRLLITQQFYERFVAVDFILIYQTDAFVFRDELDQWCAMKYDYIGAPWSGNHFYNDAPLLGTGNGGFSLRNIKSSLKVLMKLRCLEVLEQYKNFNWRGIVIRLPTILFQLYWSSRIPGNFENSYSFQEDVFWCKSAPARLYNFTCHSSILNLLGKLLVKNSYKIAPVDVASKFSFETNPIGLFQLNNGKLPFGCHAWEKYDIGFWTPFIFNK
ncbi:MAG: DUF5672 family protein [Ferruginibacter sp.]